MFLKRTAQVHSSGMFFAEKHDSISAVLQRRCMRVGL